MNAPTPRAAIAEPTVELIPLTAIAPSETHIQELRRQRFTKEGLAELADSIRKVGVLQPVVIRPLFTARGLAKYELVAGERRWLAAKQAGAAHVPASIRTLTEEEVLEVQLIENLQREGLHELEEAEGYEELMKLKKINADELAKVVGKSRSYVYARTKLLALCPEARKAFYAGELDASKALLIARIGHHDTQRQALADLTKGPAGYGGRRDGEPMSYRDAHKHILQTYMLKLKSAPFDINDANLLPKAGTCPKCPKRTGNQADLFGDVKDADVCTDPKCFDDKRQAHFAGARKAMENKGRKVIYGTEAKKLMPHWEHHDSGHIAGGQYVRLDASEYVGGRYQKIADVLGKDYQPVLIQHPLSGKFIEVAPRSTVASKAAQKQKARGSKSPRPSTAGAAPKPAEPDIEELVAEKIFALLKAKHPGTFDRDSLVHLAELEQQAWDSAPDFLLKAFGLPTSGSFTGLAKLAEKDLVRFILLGNVIDGFLGYGGNEPFARAVCKRFKVDPKAIEKQVRAELAKKKAEAKAKASPAKKAAGKKGGKK